MMGIDTHAQWKILVFTHILSHITEMQTAIILPSMFLKLTHGDAVNRGNLYLNLPPY